MTRSSRKIEFGDFQTPPDLARRVCDLLCERGVRPATIVEPTCGRGAFVTAAMHCFSRSATVLGFDVNAEHVAAARRAANRLGGNRNVVIRRADFFETDWVELIQRCAAPILVVGNPPWVANADLGALGSGNLPEKSNFQAHRGLDAITGKANFDISEWMLIKLLEALHLRSGSLAMLCKTAVARKLMAFAIRKGLSVDRIAAFAIDAKAHFQVSVDACLLVCNTGAKRPDLDAHWHSSLDESEPDRTLGVRDGRLVADVAAHDRWKPLLGGRGPVWRSGIKHDCASVMELTREGARYRNSLGELADLEPTHLYPMLKSSDLANGREGGSSRFMLVTQRSLADSTEAIRRSAPKTWRYLQAHASPLDGRASRIYRDRPRFSIFGVGPYSFSKWKVAVSGLYKKLCFRLVGPREGKPTVLDDTCYFLPAENAAEAFVLTVALNSPVAAEFLGAFIFWDEMRPIKKDALGEIDIDALVARLGADYFRDRMGEAPARVDAAALFSQSPSPVRDGTMPAVGVSPRSPSLHRRVP